MPEKKQKRPEKRKKIHLKWGEPKKRIWEGRVAVVKNSPNCWRKQTSQMGPKVNIGSGLGGRTAQKKGSGRGYLEKSKKKLGPVSEKSKLGGGLKQEGKGDTPNMGGKKRQPAKKKGESVT